MILKMVLWAIQLRRETRHEGFIIIIEKTENYINDKSKKQRRFA